MREIENSAAAALLSSGNSAHVPSIAETKSSRNEVSHIWATLGGFEWVALSYLAFSSAMVLVFARNLAHPWKLIGAQAIVTTLIFILCAVANRAEQRASHRGVSFTTRFWHFWRHWYPHLFFLFCFEELAYLVHLVNPNWQDAKLIAFDHWLFSVHPALWL